MAGALFGFLKEAASAYTGQGGDTDPRLLKDGTPARAKLTSFDDHSRNTNSKRSSAHIVLEVRPEGGSPYTWQGEADVVVEPWRWVMRGLVPDIPVRIDPADQSRLAIDWDVLTPEAEGAFNATGRA